MFSQTTNGTLKYYGCSQLGLEDVIIQQLFLLQHFKKSTPVLMILFIYSYVFVVMQLHFMVNLVLIHIIYKTLKINKTVAFIINKLRRKRMKYSKTQKRACVH